MNRFSLIALLLLTVACTPTLSTRGNLVDPDDLSSLKVGTSTKDDVRTALGTPTDTGTMNDNVWYYVGQKTERYGFEREKVTNRRVVAIAFDQAGLVQSVTPMDDKGRTVAMNERVTPTSGHDLTFAQQLFGNLGRFNKNSTGNTSNPTGAGDIYN